ncbi:MAG: hypothetical protein IJ689_05120 [Alphaproteobacteria bacterium]|nr:hypothetical protein [Alphaproteobacteria bacterium]
MKNYILLLGVAAVSIGSYVAYAGNSATMTVTARIEHDVSLTLEGDTMDFGTIYIDPSNTNGGDIKYSESGAISYKGAWIVSASAVTPMNFTANIPNKAACNNASYACGGLSLADSGEAHVFGANENNYCDLAIKYTGTGNNFKLIPMSCVFNELDDVVLGEHSDTITITYNAS